MELNQRADTKCKIYVACVSKGHTFRIQHPRDIQILLSYIEGCVQVLHRIVLGQLSVIDQIWSMTVNKSAER